MAVPMEDIQIEEKEIDGLDEDDLERITIRSGTDKDEEAKSFEITKKCGKLSQFITSILDGDCESTLIEARQTDAVTLGRVIEYLQHHNGKEAEEIPCPVRSEHLKQIVSDPWDTEWMEQFENTDILKIMLAANYMDIKPLLHLCCAKIACTIKGLPQNEINEIIQEQEAYEKKVKEEMDDDDDGEDNDEE